VQRAVEREVVGRFPLAKVTTARTSCGADDGWSEVATGDAHTRENVNFLFSLATDRKEIGTAYLSCFEWQSQVRTVKCSIHPRSHTL
jgi:hypothetical protein